MIVARKAVWMAVAAGAAMLGSLAVKHGLRKAWRLATHEDPPQDPASQDVAWREAILWTVATGAVGGLARLLAQRGAAAGWQQFTGDSPPA